MLAVDHHRITETIAVNATGPDNHLDHSICVCANAHDSRRRLMHVPLNLTSGSQQTLTSRSTARRGLLDKVTGISKTYGEASGIIGVVIWYDSRCDDTIVGV